MTKEQMRRLHTGDRVGIKKSGVIEIQAQPGLSQSQTKHGINRLGKVVYAGPHYVTVQFSQYRQGGMLLGGWCEAFSTTTDFDCLVTC